MRSSRGRRSHGNFPLDSRAPVDVYREVVAPERLVFTHVWLDAEGKPGKETLVTITFAERGGKTELTLRQTGFKSVESRDGHNEGWTSTLDRLAEYLGTMA